MNTDLTNIKTEDLKKELQDRGLSVSSPKCHCGASMEKRGIPGFRVWYCVPCGKKIMECTCRG